MNTNFTIVWMTPESTPSYIRVAGNVAPEEMIVKALASGGQPERIAQAHGNFNVEAMWDVVNGIPVSHPLGI